MVVSSSGVREPIFNSKERTFGALFLAMGILFLKIYLISFFAIRLPLPSRLKRTAAMLHGAAVELPVLALVVAFFFIVIRIGWNMLTAPPAKSLKEQEDALSSG
jgi:hypothetical protein